MEKGVKSKKRKKRKMKIKGKKRIGKIYMWFSERLKEEKKIKCVIVEKKRCKFEEWKLYGE